MKFEIKATSGRINDYKKSLDNFSFTMNDQWVGTIILKDLHDLVKLQQLINCSIIINDDFEGGTYLEIYDDYRE